MGIILPELFEEKLRTSRELRSAVDGTIADFDPWLKDSKLPFFVDYTDHGVDHLSQVLETANRLISQEAISLVSAGDVAVLTIATLLHDSAMHLSEAGFETLIQRGTSTSLIHEFDSKTWTELWDAFLFTAKRWDERKLIDVFGEIEPGVPRSTVRDPFQHYSNLSDSDRRLIGEFIRANHPRMAHEFALFGVPGSSGTAISIANGMGEDLRDISGLVARSHGLSVRPCVEYLIGKGYHKRDYQGVHAAYLMVLLRISDILQIQKERANPIAFKYKHIPSRVSVQEWKAHNAITNITPMHDDPESIEVQALPPDIGTFLRLKDWLSVMQAEFDASWAVLGEVYGPKPELRDLGLILRRVRSNLDDPKSLLRNISYVPERIEFNVARPQLLKLLVKPLYGHRPSIGVRELIQNSVDAVRELAFLQEKDDKLRRVTVIEQESDVEVWLDDPSPDGWAWLTVSDKGIGMTEEVIKCYFLMAGASFRQSDAWKREFEAEESDAKDARFKSMVLRSGRFGIGALAAFLLGDEIHVETRRAGSAYGLRFSTKLDAEPILLLRDNKLPTGTSIRIRVSPKVQEALKKDKGTVSVPGRLDWFRLNTPSVARYTGKSRRKITSRTAVTANMSGELFGWRKLVGLKNYDVYWSFDSAPILTCNGIFVTDSESLSEHYFRTSNPEYYHLHLPKIAVRDPDGNFPLTLQRDALAVNDYPIINELTDSVARDFLACLIARTPKAFSPVFLQENIHQGILPPWWYGMDFRTERFGQTFLTQGGLSILDPYVIGQMKLRSALYVESSHLRDAISSDSDALFMFHNSEGDRFLERSLNGDLDASVGFAKAKLLGIRAYVNKGLAHEVLTFKEERREPSNWRRERYLRLRALHNGLTVEAKTEGWTVLTTPDCPPPGFKIQIATANKQRANVALIEVFFATSPSANGKPGVIGKVWKQVIKQPFIPFDVAERKRSLAKAYLALREYLSFY
jgi:hypothetical protein